MAARHEPAAPAAPDPALDPPGVRSRSHGLRVTGVFWPYANSLVTVLPTMIAPAPCKRSVTVASWVGTKPSRTCEPAPVGVPPVSYRPLLATATPCSAP